MNGVGPLLALVALLVLLNAAFAGSEIALISLRDTQIARPEQRGRAALVGPARDRNRFLSTIQIGITLAGFLASATASVSLAEPLIAPLSFLGDAAGPVAIVLVTTVLTFVTLVLGELAPKRLALQRAERWALMAARPLALLARLSAPAVWVLTRTTDLVVRLLGGDPSAGRQVVTEEEIRDLVAAQPEFSRTSDASSRAPLRSTSAPSVRSSSPVCRSSPFHRTPTPARSSRLVAASHTRAPIYASDLDDVTGIVHLLDVVTATGPVREHVREAVILPESVGVLDALRRLQAERDQMAVVVNEHGGAEGIVTLEDVVEEIVGEIYDEFDRNLNSSDARGVVRQPDGSLTMPGSFPMHDLVDLSVVLPQGDYATVAGLLLDSFGHIPEPGEHLELPRWRVEVLQRDGNAIGLVRLIPTGEAAR